LLLFFKKEVLSFLLLFVKIHTFGEWLGKLTPRAPTARISRWRARRRPMLLGSLLLHVLLGLLILAYLRLNPPPEPLPPSAIAMLFESGSRNGPAALQPQHGHDAGSSPPSPATGWNI